MKAARSSPAYCRPCVGFWFRLMRPWPFGPRALNWLIASGVSGVCFSAGSTLLPRRTALMVLKFTANAEFRVSKDLVVSSTPGMLRFAGK